MGIAATVLNSWLILLTRAVYRDDSGLRRSFANATPLWVAGVAGVAALLVSGGWLLGWAEKCLPGDGWRIPGVLVVGIGVALALTAAVRLVIGRVQVGRQREPVESHDDISGQHSSTDPEIFEERLPKLPPERRRVIVEYALTYAVADVVIMIGVGLV
ncbi:MAG: hypothetical protein P0Y60_02015 [Candidatus Microbacterium colombiense]|nr:MAG: hypothetical protein P0Y60_02015 [Microbacterium sp.]